MICFIQTNRQLTANILPHSKLSWLSNKHAFELNNGDEIENGQSAIAWNVEHKESMVTGNETSIFDHEDLLVDLENSSEYTNLLPTVTLHDDDINQLKPFNFTYYSKIKQIHVTHDNELTESVIVENGIDVNHKQIDSACEYKCEVCQSSMNKLSYLIIHNRFNHCQSNATGFTCTLCLKNNYFKTIDELSSHCSKHDSKIYECPHIGCSFHSQDCRVYEMHLSIHIIELEDDLVCQDDHTLHRLSNENYSNFDQDSILNDLDVLYCKYIFDAPIAQNYNNLQDYLCNFCDKKFTSKTRMFVHRSTHEL